MEITMIILQRVRLRVRLLIVLVTITENTL
jgi:hypothetical protein